ncbi:tetratricopeptide repeat protein [Tunturiibacter gelidoferens]|uniref:Tetratricopeptide (TPR) repeat protein n=1 Tax=Tunturiibacter gelidiferens TaxID=3069689 RepID=A0ACC5P1Z6_9BACT|nr:tetratricopeptide repeat protein [Edaphobacter lichenicola]MBB5340721.1 tetratricopeptide (TPR) repeat protein [Edaphobacter lichenicola]
MKSYPVPLRRRLRPKSAKQFVERAKEFLWDAAGRITFWRLVKGFVVVFLFLPLVVYVVREVNRDVLIIDPFGVPKSLSEAGLSSEVMANRVGERLRVMEATTKTQMKKDVLGSQGEEASIPEVEIPGTKLGLKTIVDMARSLFHRDPKHIGGDIVVAAADAAQSTSDPPMVKRPAMITVYFKQGRNGSQALSGVAERDDEDMLVQRAAELALEQVNPYVLALYWEDHREFDKSIKVAQATAEDASQDLPHRGACFVVWGIALDDEEKHEEAIAEYQKAIELDPKDTHAYYDWGIALDSEGKQEEAIAKYQKTVELDPKYVNAYYNWGIALHSEGKHEEAIAKYQKTVELDPKYVNAYYNWGIALHSEGKHEEAIAKYQKTVELDPKYVNAYYNWGMALDGEGKHEEAIAKYQKTVELDPKYVNAYYNWGNALNNEGKHQEAIAKYQTAIELDPKYAFAYYNWGTALNNEGKYEEAIAKYQKAVELDPKYAFAYNNWGVALNGEGKYEEAIAKFRKAVELDPKNAFAYGNWGRALQRMGKKREAAEKFAKQKELEQSN